MTQSNYMKYRGKCKELCEDACKNDPTLKLVRGHYFEPMWNSDEQHWWTVRKDGTIYDPTKRQFPSNGHGIYTEFNGIVTCENCGKQLKEADVQFCGNYPTCSNKCSMELVGL